MATEASQPLYVRPEPPEPEAPFKGDLFERVKLAETLTSYVSRLPNGGVFAIDAQWGEGKTWFATHWQALLRARGFRTIYIDSFARDYVEDPFLVIASALTTELANEDKAEGGTLAAATARVTRALLPMATKVAMATAGRLILGSASAGEDLRKIGEDLMRELADAVERHLSDRLHEYELEHKSINYFRERLSTLAGKQSKPIVILIDELDRCRPTFAVRTIERIKHFFDVPGLVFVLFAYRPQLEAAFKGAYGQGLDAATYIGKFVQFYLGLPTRASFRANSNDFAKVLRASRTPVWTTRCERDR